MPCIDTFITSSSDKCEKSRHCLLKTVKDQDLARDFAEETRVKIWPRILLKVSEADKRKSGKRDTQYYDPRGYENVRTGSERATVLVRQTALVGGIFTGSSKSLARFKSPRVRGRKGNT